MRCSKRTLFDHLVGAGEQRRRHFEAERFGGLEINCELVRRRCLDRKVGGLLALEDAADINAVLSHCIRDTSAAVAR